VIRARREVLETERPVGSGDGFSLDLIDDDGRAGEHLAIE
jgi:hypothetical protein